MEPELGERLVDEQAGLGVAFRAGEQGGGVERRAELPGRPLAERPAADVLLQRRASVGRAKIVVEAAQRIADFARGAVGAAHNAAADDDGGGDARPEAEEDRR